MNENQEPVRNGSVGQGRFDAGVNSLLKALRMAFGGLILVILGMLVYFIGFDSAFQVLPQEAVIAMRFGKIIDVYDSGWQWFMPYPVTSYVRIPVSQRTMSVDFNAAELGGQAPGQMPLLIPGRDKYLITADKNIVHASWGLTYKITDPRKYYTNLATPKDPMGADELVFDSKGRPNGRRGPETTLRNLLTNAVINVTCQVTVDEVLYASSDYVSRVKAQLASSLDILDSGIEIESLILQQSGVPLAVKPAFDAAQAAKAAQATQLEAATSYSDNLAYSTEAECSAIISAAENYRLEVVKSIAADAQYFKKINEACKDNAKAVLIPLYYDAVGEVIKTSKDKFLLGTGNEHEVRMRLNPELPAPAADGDAAGEERNAQ